MAPPTKSTDGARRKSGSKGGLTITLTVSPEKLRDIIEPHPSKEESPSATPVVDPEPEPEPEQETEAEAKETQESPATSATLQAAPASNGDNASDSNPATPAASGTPAPAVMGPPTEGVKKKGVKRSAGAANGVGPDGQPKVRGKPGPKKKQRLEDGSLDIGGRGGGVGIHKLGPKANQGAINAGLRALDRSGKPCRRWSKGGFTLKSFTGIVWEIPRWTAPPKPLPEVSTEESAAASADSSSKENKENSQGQIKSDANSAADAEARSTQSVPPSSPAPMAVAAAS